MTIKQELQGIVGYDEPTLQKLEALLKKAFDNGAKLQKEKCKATLWGADWDNINDIIEKAPAPEFFIHEDTTE